MIVFLRLQLESSQRRILFLIFPRIYSFQINRRYMVGQPYTIIGLKKFETFIMHFTG